MSEPTFQLDDEFSRTTENIMIDDQAKFYGQFDQETSRLSH